MSAAGPKPSMPPLTIPPRTDNGAAYRRRREAARRLPPLPCGCHDPDTLTHQRGECRWRRNRRRA